MAKNEYSLTSMIKQYGGICRVFSSADFLGAILIAVIFITAFTYSNDWATKDFITAFSDNLLNIASALFGILFAAFAIILSLSDEKFMKFLKKVGVLEKILFPFWLISILYIISIFINLLPSFFDLKIAKYISSFGLFIFAWALLGTIYLINETISFGLRRADYLEYEKEIEKLDNKKK